MKDATFKSKVKLSDPDFKEVIKKIQEALSI
jgi:hypothetical protein